MISKSDAKLLDEIAERKLLVGLRNDDLTLQCSNVQIFATRPGQAYSATVSVGNSSMTFIIARLKGYSRMKDGTLMLKV
jgi:hypothetical protein